MTTVETTAGPIDASAMGRTLCHEHLGTTSEAVRAQFPHLYDEQAEFDAAVTQVRRAMEHGVRTIVDPACMDLGRDARFAQRVAAETGIQLVLATGIYGEHYSFIAHHFETRDEDYLADVFVHDLEQGIQGTAIKAAFLKTAADEPGITPGVEKVHRAAARASLRTGAPIMAHSRPASRTGLDQMRIFLDEGVAPDKVMIAHTGDTDDLAYIEELLALGPFIGMDRYGTEIFLPDAQRNTTVAALVERGFADRMVLSHDACATIDWFPPELIAQLAPNWHFTHLFETVIGQLLELGVPQAAIDTMLDVTPRRWLAGG
jgi:phosphotriesterase-related protein